APGRGGGGSSEKDGGAGARVSDMRAAGYQTRSNAAPKRRKFWIGGIYLHARRRYKRTDATPRPDRRTRTAARASRARGVPAGVAGRGSTARMGSARRRPRQRRRARRSPHVRGSADWPPARLARVQGGHREPAAVGRGERARRLRRLRPPAPLLRRLQRQHGLDGEPLHRRQEATELG